MQPFCGEHSATLALKAWIPQTYQQKRISLVLQRLRVFRSVPISIVSIHNRTERLKFIYASLVLQDNGHMRERD